MGPLENQFGSLRKFWLDFWPCLSSASMELDLLEIRNVAGRGCGRSKHRSFLKQRRKDRGISSRF